MGMVDIPHYFLSSLQSFVARWSIWMAKQRWDFKTSKCPTYREEGGCDRRIFGAEDHSGDIQCHDITWLPEWLRTARRRLEGSFAPKAIRSKTASRDWSTRDERWKQWSHWDSGLHPLHWCRRSRTSWLRDLALKTDESWWEWRKENSLWHQQHHYLGGRAKNNVCACQTRRCMCSTYTTRRFDQWSQRRMVAAILQPSSPIQ